MRDDERHIRNALWFVIFLMATLIIGGWLAAPKVHAFAEVPPGDMIATQEDFPNPSHKYFTFEFPPHISKYVTPESDYAQRGAALIPNNPGKKVPVIIMASGWPGTLCANWDFSDSNAIIIKVCHDHQPNADLFKYPMSWGGAFAGENPLGWRIAAQLAWVTEHYGHMIDHAAGVSTRGFSYAGSTMVFNSMIQPDDWARALITVVEAGGFDTLFFKQTPPLGRWEREENVRLAWGGYDWTRADWQTKANKNVYHKITCSPVDNIVTCDPAVFALVFDALQVPGFGLLYGTGHAAPEPDLNLPFDKLYSGPDSFSRLDKILPAFTHSTANYLEGTYGHYNLGLEWHTGNSVNTVSHAVIPIRYRRHTGIGFGVPDQPTAATFNITLRRIRLRDGFALWQAGAQSGLAAVSGRTVTIPNLTLMSSTAYTNVEIWQ